MTLTRRDLLKRSIAAGSLLPLVGLDVDAAEAASGLKTDGMKETKTICPYCSVGCGISVYTDNDGNIVSAYGDPDHPINEGSLCSKGSSLMNLRVVADKFGKWSINPARVTKVKYRAPGATEFVEKDWDWALTEIAKRVKTVRDASFQQKDGAVTVNRTFAMAHIGSAALDNEENYALHKMMRSLGVVRLEHHARL